MASVMEALHQNMFLTRTFNIREGKLLNGMDPMTTFNFSMLILSNIYCVVKISALCIGTPIPVPVPLIPDGLTYFSLLPSIVFVPVLNFV